MQVFNEVVGSLKKKKTKEKVDYSHQPPNSTCTLAIERESPEKQLAECAQKKSTRVKEIHSWHPGPYVVKINSGVKFEICKWPGHTLTWHFASANDLILSLLHEKWVDLVQKAQYLLMPDNMAPDKIPPVRVGAFHPNKRTCNFLFCSHVCLHDACNNTALTFWLKHREFENRLDINIVLVQTLFCFLIKEISFKLQMETVSMLMIFAVMLCYLSSSQRKAEVRVQVPLRPKFFRPFVCFCSSSITYLWRSLKLKSLLFLLFKTESTCSWNFRYKP